MWSKLQEVFEEVGLTYSRQGSFTEGEELPESFFTFWNADTESIFHYDDDDHKTQWFWYVYLYTKNPAIMYSKLEEFIKLAKEKGFNVDGKGIDIPSDVPDYLGRYVRLTYVEDNKN